MITLKKTSTPFGLAIGPAEETEELQATQATDLIAEAEAIVAAAEPLIAAARAAISAQDETTRLRARIQDLERELELERASKRADSTPLQLPPARGERQQRQTLSRRVTRRVKQALGTELPIRSPRARHLLDNEEPLFLDLETTGRTKRDRIVEVSVLDARGQVVFSTLVNPERRIPPETTEIHGIGDRDVADAPTWEQVKPQLRQMLENRVIVAHYAKFEAKFLPNNWGIEWVCSKELADAVFGKAHWMEAKHDWRRSGKLADRVRQCGLQPGPEHSAAGDCLSALRLVRYLAGYGEPVNLTY
jgi:DNA polymerase-3 subunit epsilon